MFTPLVPYWYRAEFRPVWATDYSHALQMIKEAVQGEKSDELFYEELIQRAPSKEQKEIIAAIRDDERGHNRMFRDIYRDLTGQEVPAAAELPYVKLSSYPEGLVKALFGELSAVERYRTIWSALPAGVYKDTVLGILMDEQKHASKYNYLITLNQASENSSKTRSYRM
ncbi:ferritin family protein [Gorillibacterium timonense]|uniref:ferritin family protein n=1 Tax=Gorillibacterium timonense TaxID=1689269 RepID=UPI00071CFE54|nr:ferritin-like domain-containing protein [Gorillibacterium timonense]